MQRESSSQLNVHKFEYGFHAPASVQSHWFYTILLVVPLAMVTERCIVTTEMLSAKFDFSQDLVCSNHRASIQKTVTETHVRWCIQSCNCYDL